MPVGSVDKAQQLFELGAQFVNLGGDFGFVMEGLEKASNQWREALGNAAGEDAVNRYQPAAGKKRGRE